MLWVPFTGSPPVPFSVRQIARPLALITTLALASCGGPDPIGSNLAPLTGDPRYAAGFGVTSPVTVLSAQELQCRRQLKRLNVKFTPVPPVYGKGACGIEAPLSVTSLSKRIALKPAATMNCRTALAAARWAHDDLAPAARRRYASNVREVRHMSAYSCRRIRGSGRLSEHGKGNALDIGSFRLGNGRKIDVAKPGFFSFREKSFLKSIRKGACKHFRTVLGPGSDRDHADHFHFDMKQRRSGSTYCNL